MKLVRLFQERLSRRRRHRPARRPRFSQRFAADLVIKPLENRLVLSSGSVLPPELVLTLSGSGNLVISDVQGTHNDTVTLQSDTQHAQYIITDPSQALDVSSINGATLSPDGHTAFVPFASVTGNQIVADLGGGDDSLTIDFTLGSFSQSIDYAGGDGEDSLTITGMGLISTYTPSDVAGSGTIVVGGENISFTGIEPIDVDVVGGSFVLDLPGTTSDSVTIDQSTLVGNPSQAALKVSGTVNGTPFENARVRGATIAINTHGGNDTVTVNATGSNHLDSSLSINTGTDSGDKTVIAGEANSSGATTLDAPRIDLQADVTHSVSGSTATTVNVSGSGQIQDGINVSASGATVTVGAGIYAENLTIDHSLTLLGPNVGISGNGSRVSEASVNGNVDVSTTGSVKIDGFTVNGTVSDPGADLVIQNDIITAAGNAVDISGANSALISNNQITSNAGSAIVGMGVSSNVTVSGNTLLAAQRAIDVANVGGNVVVQGNAVIAGGDGFKLDSVLGAVQLGGLVSGQENTITAGQSGIVLLAGGVMGVATVQNNTVFANDSGIDFEDGVNDFTATGNELVAGSGAGIVVNGATSGTITLGGATTADKNIVTASFSANGISVTSLASAVNVTIQGNELASDAIGLFVNQAPGNITIQGNSFTGIGSSVGLELKDLGTAVGKTVLIGGLGVGDGNTFFNVGTGIVLDGSLATTKVTLSQGNTITGGTTGLMIQGANVSLVGNTLSDLTLTGQSGNYVTLSGGALAGQTIDGTGVTFDGVLGNSVTTSQGYGLVDRFVDAIDDGSVGFVRIQTGSVFVTPNSFTAATLVANIQRAVNAAASGDTIHIEAGSYTGNIDAATGGKNLTLAPGDGGTAQVVNNGNLLINTGDALNTRVNGTNPLTQFDNFVIQGTVNLSGATLLTSGTISSASTDIVLINNDGNDAVTGTFNGLPEGAVVTINGVNFSITYHGGDGNDVVLSAVVADTFITLVGGNLTIADINTASDDTLTIQSDVANSRFIISDPDHILGTDIVGATGNFTHTIYVPFAAVTGGFINANTLGGIDNLTVDYSLGHFAKSIHDDGGQDSDTLTITGSGLNAVYTPSATTTGDGTIVIDGSETISFVSLAPINYDVIGGSFRLLTPNANDVIGIEDSTLTTSATPALRISGTSGGVGFEEVRVHGSAVTINTTAVAGTDTVTINSASGAHGVTALTINEGAEAGDVLNVNGTVTVSGMTTLDAKTINLNANVTNAVTGSTASSVTVNIIAPFLADRAQIQDGIDVSASGATVTVGAGIYNENLS